MKVKRTVTLDLSDGSGRIFSNDEYDWSFSTLYFQVWLIGESNKENNFFPWNNIVQLKVHE